MKNKGFTLIELLCVIVILGLLSLIVVPVVDKLIKQNREQLYQDEVKNIESSAKNWAAENVFSLPEENEGIVLTICDLMKAGFLDYDIKNPKTGKAFWTDMQVVINHDANGFQYSFNEDSGTEGLTSCN